MYDRVTLFIKHNIQENSMGWPYDNNDDAFSNMFTSPNNTGFNSNAFNAWSDGATSTQYNDFANLGGEGQKDFMNYVNNQGKPEGFGFNNSTLGGVGSALQGVGSLAGAWAGLKQVKLGREELASQKEQWNKNYEAQSTTTNNRLRDQNAWKTAQGRSDMATLVPKYGTIG